MGWFGLNGFFVFLILIHSLIGAFGLYRMRVRETVENPDSTFTPVPATITPAGLELDPDAPATLDQNSNTGETQKTFGLNSINLELQFYLQYLYLKMLKSDI